MWCEADEEQGEMPKVIVEVAHAQCYTFIFFCECGIRLSISRSAHMFSS